MYGGEKICSLKGNDNLDLFKNEVFLTHLLTYSRKMLFEFDSKFLVVGKLIDALRTRRYCSIYMYILLSLFEDMKTEESIFSDLEFKRLRKLAILIYNPIRS
jgi:hypothetical protein